jgi:hypothetical protein
VKAHVVGGVTAVGETLNATSGSWVVYPETTSYQWYRCASAVTSHQLIKPGQCDAILDETDQNYLLDDADYGKFLSVSMTKSNELGTLTVWSRTAGAVGSKPESVTSPTLFGSPETGQSLTISSGQWTGDPAPDLSFAMYACDGPITSQSAIETPGCQQFFGPAVTSLSLGTDNSCFSNDDGNVVCWGSNKFGEAGDGTTVTRPAAVVARAESVSQISVGERHTCALLDSGEVDCWGLNQGGALGDGTRTASSLPRRVIGVSNAIEVASGFEHSCALREDGTVVCWGQKIWIGGGSVVSSAEQVPGLENVIQISHSMRHACAVLADGTVKCWGNNEEGQIGDGTNQTRVTPVFVSGINNATAVSTGQDNTCALLADGTVKCWGDNGGSQLGLNANADSNVPVILGGISSAVQISITDRSACALISDGTIKCVGDNRFAGLGNGTETPITTTPTTVFGIDNAVAIETETHRGCALLETNQIKCWGYSGFPEGDGGGRIGDGAQIDRYSPVSIRFDLSTDVIFPISQQLEGKWLIAGVRGVSKYGTSSDSWSNPIGPIGPTP